jgi:hypothetical protein
MRTAWKLAARTRSVCQASGSTAIRTVAPSASMRARRWSTTM